MEEERGTIAFFTTYRPPVPLDIYSSPYKPTNDSDEMLMTDGKHYNYNAKVIPPSSLKTIINYIRNKQSETLHTTATDADVDAGRVTGLIFVSERTNNLETLHIGIKFHDKSPKFEAFNFAEVYGTFNGTRMEDSGSIAGDYLIYGSTKDPAKPHQPWNAVFKTNLLNGQTDRLTLNRIGGHDLSPAVSPNGKRVAVASFQRTCGWRGEIEDLRTDIFVMNVDRPLKRKHVILNGGWPSWGSNDVLFFHRNINSPDNPETRWVVFQLDLRTNPPTQTRVTPEEINAISPAAINETTVAVSTIRNKYDISNPEKEREIDQFRHIEIFNLNGEPVIKVTEIIRPTADHFNPFVYTDKQRRIRIGYHRCNTDNPEAYRVIGRKFDQLQSPDSENVGLVRLTGVFPTFSPDGSKLAFVDNEFKALWIADSTGPFVVYETSGADNIFSPVWNSNNDIDTIYFCLGPSFQANSTVDIAMIQNVCTGPREKKGCDTLTAGYNNAFPFTNPEGTKIVYRSTRGHDEDREKKYKNLFIMAAEGDGSEEPERLTNGKWTDTHCQWSPNGKWIAFASNRANPDAEAPPGLPDAGYFGIYLTKSDDPNFVPVKVIDSGFLSPGKLFPGHCVHPCFSPKGDSLVFAADLAAVSVEPITMPLFMHSVRPYGDTFIVNLNIDDINKNEDIKDYIRITHSRYEASTATWTKCSTDDPYTNWNQLITGHERSENYTLACPYLHGNGVESISMTGHVTSGGKRCC